MRGPRFGKRGYVGYVRRSLRKKVAVTAPDDLAHVTYFIV